MQRSLFQARMWSSTEIKISPHFIVLLPAASATIFQTIFKPRLKQKKTTSEQRLWSVEMFHREKKKRCLRHHSCLHHQLCHLQSTNETSWNCVSLVKKKLRTHQPASNSSCSTYIHVLIALFMSPKTTQETGFWRWEKLWDFALVSWQGRGKSYPTDWKKTLLQMMFLIIEEDESIWRSVVIRWFAGLLTVKTMRKVRPSSWEKYRKTKQKEGKMSRISGGQVKWRAVPPSECLAHRPWVSWPLLCTLTDRAFWDLT